MIQLAHCFVKGGSDYVCASAPQQYHDALYTETIGACLLRRGFCVLTQGTLRRRRMDSGGAFLRFFTVERSESYQNIFVHCPSADADHAGIPV